MIQFGADLHDYTFARRKEYLLTAGDAYCSSSLAGNTRKYHGLIVAGKRVYLSGLEEHVNGERISVHRYAGALQDKGLFFLNGFELYPPRFYFMAGGASIKKTIEFDGRLSIRYDVEGEAELRIRPLVTDRSYHETKHDIDLKAACMARGFRMGKLSMQSGLDFAQDSQTYFNVFYEQDAARGYDHVEDLSSPGYFHGTVKDSSITISASLDGLETIRRNEPVPDSPMDFLDHAADSFLVGDTIFAGYHWFAEPWGRDTFVSLPGLLLERGRFEEAKRAFRHFGRHIEKGLMPNRIPGGYNSSDAPLWFVYAIGKYFGKRDDPAFLRESKVYVENLLSGYPDSEVASLDGALISSAPETTWMDTRYTGRKGKAVEVNALWINALEVADQMEIATPVKPVAARREFGRFWNEKKGCLYDIIDPLDDSVRPNQAIAVALGAIDGENAKKAMDVARKELLTPYGLRTLSPRDCRYIGKFGGDISYHNGCVWPWLMGFYIEAALKTGEPKERLRPLLEPLLLQTLDAGLGTISEIFDGDAPHEPNGCISQAWSVAEVMRAQNMLR